MLILIIKNKIQQNTTDTDLLEMNRCIGFSFTVLYLYLLNWVGGTRNAENNPVQSSSGLYEAPNSVNGTDKGSLVDRVRFVFSVDGLLILISSSTLCKEILLPSNNL